MKYKTFQEFEQALDAIKPEDFERSPLDYDHDAFSAAYNAAWDAAPKKWQKKYTKKHHGTFPMFSHRRDGQRLPHVHWGYNHKKWYSWMIKRPVPHYWNRFACFVNGKHEFVVPVKGSPIHKDVDQSLAVCSSCSKILPRPDGWLTEEQEWEVGMLVRKYEDAVVAKGKGRGLFGKGVVTPWIQEQSQLEGFKEWIRAALEELEKEDTPE